MKELCYKGKNITIYVISKLEADMYKFDFKYISITIGTDENIKLSDDKNRVDRLDLLFDDLDTTKYNDKDLTDLYKEYKPKLFNKDMATKILEFVDKYKGLTIVVNCEAGVSRSAGVGAALSKIYNNDDNWFFKNRCPNMLVYRTILNKYYEES